MSENKNESQDNGEVRVVLEEEFKDIVNNAQREEKLTSKQLEKLTKEAKDTLEFLSKIEDVNLKYDTRVIFTDGKEQLVYENGEFFLEATTDSTKTRKKKKKSEAKDMYLEYFMKYKLNYLIKKKEQHEVVKGINREVNNTKEVNKDIKSKKIQNKTSQEKAPKKEVTIKKQDITR